MCETISFQSPRYFIQRKGCEWLICNSKLYTTYDWQGKRKHGKALGLLRIVLLVSTRNYREICRDQCVLL